MAALQWCVPLLFLGACVGSNQGPNSLYRSRLEISLTDKEAEVVRLEGRLWALRQDISEAESDAADAQDESWRAEGVLRERSAELDRQLRTLQALEEDLLAAQQRRAEIEAELAEVRELEAQLAQKEQRMTELSAESDAKDAELAEKQAALELRKAEVAERFAELEKQGEVLESLEALVQKALEEILAIAGPFFGTAPEGEGKDAEGKAPDGTPDGKAPDGKTPDDRSR